MRFFIFSKLRTHYQHSRHSNHSNNHTTLSSSLQSVPPAMGTGVSYCVDREKECALESPTSKSRNNSETATSVTSISSNNSTETDVECTKDTEKRDTVSTRHVDDSKVEKQPSKRQFNVLKLIQKKTASLADYFYPSSDFNPDLQCKDTAAVSGVGKGVLLDGCESMEEHRAFIQHALERVQNLTSARGLHELGFEYRLEPCNAHQMVASEPDSCLASVTSSTPSGVLIQDQIEEEGNDNESEADNEGEQDDFSEFVPYEYEQEVVGETSNDLCVQHHHCLSSSPTSSISSPHASSMPPTMVLSNSQLDLLSTCSMGGNSAVALDSTSAAACSNRRMQRTVSADTLYNMPLDVPLFDIPSLQEERANCQLCMRRLYHVASNTLITSENRNRFIADGDMYEQVARLCQEYAHDVMCQEGGLEWVQIEQTPNDQSDDPLCASADEKPIRALVNSDHPALQRRRGEDAIRSEMANRPTLFIATGRGKVRAGIFSRQHLIASGLESATAVPLVREAKRRRLNIIIIDPNVNGERAGYVTFTKSMDYTLSQLHNVPNNTNTPTTLEQEDVVDTLDNNPTLNTSLSTKDLYILSHSASGGHLARYFLDKPEHHLPHIRAIAFTDSTHNIQWAKTHNKDCLYDLLQSDKCVYFRCSNIGQETNNKWYIHRAGEEAQTDTFWKNRFGQIKTYWAGTNEHSMTNWYAHQKIWEHFDHHLQTSSSVNKKMDNLNMNDDVEVLSF